MAFPCCMGHLWRCSFQVCGQLAGFWFPSTSSGQAGSSQLDPGLVLGPDWPVAWCRQRRVLGRDPTPSRGLPCAGQARGMRHALAFSMIL